MKTQTESIVEQYLQHLRQLNEESTEGEDAQAALLQLIEKYIQDSAGDPLSVTFFQAEYAFYCKQYREALQGYLEAKKIPIQPFFCYRASAFLLAQLGQTQKALQFAKRALDFQHHDRETIRLCKELNLDQRAQSSEEGTLETVSLAAEEFDALAGIFDEDAAETLAQTEDPIPTKPTNPPNALEERIEAFRTAQEQLLSDYIAESSHPSKRASQVLDVLNGWNQRQEAAWLTEGPRQSQGGYYLRWHGLGIVINPGKHFLRNFHEQGLYLHDIDCVIVTSTQPESYADIHAIYEFNSRLNRNQSRLHLIRYYLNRQAYQAIASDLRPHFKQEAGSVHSLELYLDSPDSESIALNDQVLLHYFATTRDRTQLGIKLTLNSKDPSAPDQTRQVGYVTRTPWSPLLTNNLRDCDVVLLGIENSGPEDYEKRLYNEESLGYFGAISLLQEISPQLLLCCEFAGSEGDIRLELIRSMRHECKGETVILPGDTGLQLDLEKMTVRCSVTGASIKPVQVQVSKSREVFGTLQYLSPECLL